MNDRKIGRRDFLKEGGLGALGLALGLSSRAQARDHTLNADEKKAVDNCVALMRGVQLENGAINMRTERDLTEEGDVAQALEGKEITEAELEKLQPDIDKAQKAGKPIIRKADTIRVVPYFANQAALAMVHAYSMHTKDTKDLEYVAKWLKFYEKHQEQDTKENREEKLVGGIRDFKGSMKKYEASKDKKNFALEGGDLDSSDAYASTFLQVVAAYHEAVSKLKPDSKERKALEEIIPQAKLVKAAVLALTAIEQVTEPDGLTWAKPDYKIKYLLDNVEVYGGLTDAAKFFKDVGRRGEATKAEKMAQKMEKPLKEFWQKDEKCFAWALDEAGDFSSGLGASYPHALANMGGLAWISGKDKAPWNEMVDKFKMPDGHNPVERWYMGAVGIADGKDSEEGTKWRKETAKTAEGFNKATNIHRAAIATLALLKDRDWMPNITQLVKEKGQQK